MATYTKLKNIEDGFIHLTPIDTFIHEFSKEPAVIYNSRYLPFDFKLEETIIRIFDHAQCHIQRRAVGRYNEIVNEEAVYIQDGCVFAVKYDWDLKSLMDDNVKGTEDIKFRYNKKIRFEAKLQLYCLHDSEFCKMMYHELISNRVKKINKIDRELNVICNNSMEGFYLQAFKTKKIKFNIEDNYNDDFQSVSEEIIRRLSNKHDNGIVLLHSDPGMGKTFYIRALTQKIKNKKLIYLPPDMALRLADPDFMTFLMNYPDSILFIEDAENSLMKRDGTGSNPAVSNLLNNSDGLLGDALRLQIVCTFNCSITSIDPALLRPGRLIAEYKFTKLKFDKCLSLIGKLYGTDSSIYQNYKDSNNPCPLSLADIYSMGKERHVSANANTNSIGFKR